MPTAPRGVLVRGPRPAAPIKYGLLNVVQPVTPEDPHWEVSGVEWEDFLCTTVESFIEDCPPATGHTKSKERDLKFCASDPFIIKGSFDCSTGGRRVGDAFEIARQRLLNWEGHELESVFWTGLSANGVSNPSLAFGNDECEIDVFDLTPVGGPVDPVGGIATLEEALTDSVPNGGVIHVPYGLSAYLANFQLLVADGDRYYTPTGNAYVLGSGYPGSGPANVAAAAGTTWIYATGPVAVWRSDVFMTPTEISQAIDRQINDVTVYAERVYAVGYSCAVYAINVDLTCVC